MVTNPQPAQRQRAKDARYGTEGHPTTVRRRILLAPQQNKRLWTAVCVGLYLYLQCDRARLFRVTRWESGCGRWNCCRVLRFWHPFFTYSKKGTHFLGLYYSWTHESTTDLFYKAVVFCVLILWRTVATASPSAGNSSAPVWRRASVALIGAYLVAAEHWSLPQPH
jgi:hypothetical protein